MSFRHDLTSTTRGVAQYCLDASKANMICSLNATICTGDVIFHNVSYGISFGGVEKCSESCGGYDMVSLQRSILKYAILAFSILTLLSSAISLAFYIRNYRKIHHPEAPIYYISICYLGIAFQCAHCK